MKLEWYNIREREISLQRGCFVTILAGFWISFSRFSFLFSDYAQSRPAFLQTRFRLISISIIPARYYPRLG